MESFISPSNVSLSAEWFTFSMTILASLNLPFFTSQRGLWPTKNNNTKNIIAGAASEINIHRQLLSPVSINARSVAKAINIPMTRANWNVMAKRPRYFAGAISEIYMGDKTDDPPTANPPIMRKTMKELTWFDRPVPMAESRNNAAITFSMFLRPYLSPGLPIEIAPMMQPRMAELITQPSITLSS